MIFPSKTRNHRHPDHLHPVLIANEQTIFQKNVSVVPMQQIDPKASKASNRSIHPTIEMMGETKEIRPTQDHHQFSKTF